MSVAQSQLSWRDMHMSSVKSGFMRIEGSRQRSSHGPIDAPKVVAVVFVRPSWGWFGIPVVLGRGRNL